MVRLFVPQDWVDSAHMSDRIAVEGLFMDIKADGKRYRLTEAVRILAVEGGDPDHPALVGKVKTHEQIVSLGGEQIGDSLICGETAYRVQQGFIAEYEGQGDPVSIVFRA